MDALLQDIRYALRGFARSPGFTFAALLSAAFGIGATTAVFSVANAVLFRALPYSSADRLVVLWNRSPGLNITQDWFSTAQYFDIRSSAASFDNVAIAFGDNFNMTGIAEPVRVGAVRVSSNLLPLFGARAALGRLFISSDDAPGRAGTAVLTHGAWARWYGPDPGAVGKSIVLNGKSYQIIGVLPRGFALPKEVLPTLYGPAVPDLFLPLPLDAAAVNLRDHEDYNIVASLKKGSSARTAQAEMDALTARLRREHPDLYPPNGGLTFGVVPLFEQVSGGARRPLAILLASVGFVLLIACSNLANLLLSRGAARMQEILVRTAVGAPRSRIVRQLLTESLLIALGGGALGVLLAAWGVAWVRTLGPGSVPRLDTIGIDLRVLLFTAAIAALTGVLSGLAPALRLSRWGAGVGLQQSGLRVAGGGSLWGRGNYLRRSLVVLEAALSVTLLIGAGLFIRSFATVREVTAGFDPHQVLTANLTMSGRKYDSRPSVVNTYRLLLDKLAQLPGVQASGGVSALPLSEMFAWGPVTVEGRALRPGESFINADQRSIAGRYFEAMRIPLVEGRFFDDRDTGDSARVAIVDDNMARQLWPGESAVRKRIRYGGINDKFPWMTVVGVVGRVKQDALDADSRIAVYMPHAQQPTRAMSIVVRGSAPTALAPALRQAISSLDPDLPVYDVRTMDERVAASLARRRFATGLLELSAALALLLSAAGIYGVMSGLVTQGTRDIGIRMALGATRADIARMVLGGGLTLSLAGATLGMAAAAGLTRFMASLLFGVHPMDPVTFIGTPVLLLSVAAAATYFPARRAWRTEPVAALRME